VVVFVVVLARSDDLATIVGAAHRHTRWGRRGLWQRGHELSVGATILCCERRFAVRLWDCFCLGACIGAQA